MLILIPGHTGTETVHITTDILYVLKLATSIDLLLQIPFMYSKYPGPIDSAGCRAVYQE